MDATRIGAKLFEDRTAEVFELGNDQIFKLFQPQFEKDGQYEARCIREAAASGIRVPKCMELVEFQHRFGIVLERVQGKTMLELADENPASQADLGRQLVDIQAALFRPFPPHSFKNRLQCLNQDLTQADLPRATRGRLMERLKRLDTGERLLCHYDLHLGNVILSPEPVILGWVETSLGPPICDFARTLHLEGYPDHVGTPSESLVDAMLERAIQHLGVVKEDIDEWIPIIAGARLNEGPGDVSASKLAELANRVA